MNPFTPSFGVLPQQFAGRTAILTEIGTALNSEGSDPALTAIFVGPRGCGKTCLLSYFEKEAASCGWISANVFCVPGLLDSIQTEAYRSAVHLCSNKKGLKLSELQLKLSAGMIEGEVKYEKKNQYVTWRSEMTDLLLELDKTGTGLLITIDEVDPKVEELIQMISIYQMWRREGRRVGLLMAGLPHNVSNLISDENVSFLRRAFRYDIGRIEDYDIRNALSMTFQNGGKDISEADLDTAVKAIGGQPYIMQLVGYRAYQAAGENGSISHDNMLKGIELAQKDYLYGVLKPTIDSLTRAELQVLRAMLQDEDASDSAELNHRLKKSNAYMNIYGPRLLAHGVIEKTGRRYRYALPMMREYLQTLA